MIIYQVQILLEVSLELLSEKKPCLLHDYSFGALSPPLLGGQKDTRWVFTDETNKERLKESDNL